MSYKFQSVGDTEKLAFGSNICNFIDNYVDYGNKFSLVYGKMKALFGQLVYETENLENLFSYCILATSEDGEEVYLGVYCAGTGPAVGGEQNEASKKAAMALVDYVWQAETVDYEQKGYYMDGPTVLEFGIKNGVPYYNESELELSEKEFSELYAKLYGI
ncbi:MAG: hypothetical protein K2N44_12765 [Lachnospiraceae bacterium]|nr:hypothetical protein [Lachnospiraceae bacterium]